MKTKKTFMTQPVMLLLALCSGGAVGCTASSGPSESSPGDLDAPPSGCIRTLCDVQRDNCENPTTPDDCKQCWDVCSSAVYTDPSTIPNCASVCQSVCDSQTSQTPSDPCGDALTACRHSSENALCVDDGSPGGSAITGTVQGMPMPTTDHVGVNFTSTVQAGGTFTGTVAGIVITNTASTCNDMEANVNRPRTQVLSLFAAQSGSSVSPGTFTISPSGAIATFFSSDAQCGSVVNAKATGGTLTIDVANASRVAGSFDATFPNGDHLTGRFSAPTCNWNPSATAPAPTCGP